MGSVSKCERIKWKGWAKKKLNLGTINVIAPSCLFITLWHLNFIVYLHIQLCIITINAAAEWRRKDAYLTQCNVRHGRIWMVTRKLKAINCRIIFKTLETWQEKCVKHNIVSLLYQYLHTHNWPQNNKISFIHSGLVREIRHKVHQLNPIYALLS